MDNEIKKMNDEELNEIAGGKNALADSKHPEHHSAPAGTRTVTGLQSGWLALRNAPAYNANNEVGHLYNGDVVTVTGGTSYEGNTPYVWVYSDKLKMSGWVNATFLG
ncbi:MAG: hypothetical protein J6E41_11305 [Lachnospiraceae bacterium]|nr:hypothetical protein [Lachnospiraceae bacterium]